MSAPLDAAPGRTAHGPVALAGLTLAVVLIGVGGLLIRDALVGANLLGGAAVVPALLRAADHLAAATWMVPAGVAAAVAGLALMITAIRPGARRDAVVDAATGVFLTRHGVARLASDAAGEVGGVLRAHSSAGRRQVTTTVESTTAEPTLADEVQQAVSARLAGLDPAPAVRIRVRPPQIDNRKVL